MLVTWFQYIKIHRHIIPPNNKNDLSNHPFIKDEIFEATVNFSPRFTPIGIITYYFEHRNMTYIYLSNNNSPCKIALPSRQINNVWVLSIGIKDPTTLQKVVEDVPSQQLTGKCNNIQVIIDQRHKTIMRRNLL